jgi:hypothetical protein
MTMATRKHRLVLLVALALCGAATGAAADTQWEWRPRVSLTGGYDDNVLINGGGGDGFGEVVPGLKLDVFGEHQLHVMADCQAGFARLANPDEYGFSGGTIFTNENCNVNWKQKFTDRDKFSLRTDATYAQDPFAIASLGLLLRPGQTHIFLARFTAENEHALSGHTAFNLGMDASALAFEAGDPGNGYVLAPRVRYLWKTDARTQWDIGFREQLFFGIAASPNPLAPHGNPGGLLDQSHAALLGLTYDIAPWSQVVVRGGPLLVTGNVGDVVIPTVRAEWNSYTPFTEIRLTLGHDLVIGPSGAGPLVGDIAELGFIKQWEQLSAHLRVGAYRNATSVQQWEAGTSGYGSEIGVDWAFTRNLRFGVSAERDATIYDPTIVGNAVNRDIVQVRLTYEKANFN